MPVRLAYFSHLLDVVQEEKPRARTRRWPAEEAPSIGGFDGRRDGHEGFFRHPLGRHPLGRASAGGPEMPDGRPLRGGSGSNAVRGRFFVSVKPCQGLCRRGSLLGPSTVPSPAPWRRRPPRSAAEGGSVRVRHFCRAGGRRRRLIGGRRGLRGRRRGAGPRFGRCRGVAAPAAPAAPAVTYTFLNQTQL